MAYFIIEEIKNQNRIRIGRYKAPKLRIQSCEIGQKLGIFFLSKCFSVTMLSFDDQFST
jgi:hypothetical protein